MASVSLSWLFHPHQVCEFVPQPRWREQNNSVTNPKPPAAVSCEMTELLLTLRLQLTKHPPPTTSYPICHHPPTPQPPNLPTSQPSHSFLGWKSVTPPHLIHPQPVHHIIFVTLWNKIPTGDPHISILTVWLAKI